mgnify:CR=1 FL=1
MTAQAIAANGAGMKRIALIVVSLALASPALAQGQVGTVPRGQYICELPGDASGNVGIEQSEENFRITSGSRYVTAEGEGTYLRRGDRVTMTSGPRNGTTYAVMADGFLRKIENGEPGRLRCIRRER